MILRTKMPQFFIHCPFTAFLWVQESAFQITASRRLAEKGSGPIISVVVRLSVCRLFECAMSKGTNAWDAAVSVAVHLDQFD